MKKQIKHILPVFLAAAAALLIVIIVPASVSAAYKSAQKQSASDRAAAAGAAHLEQMEKASTSAVEAKVSAMREQETMAKIASGKGSIWDQFQDYAILGDSRASAFYENGLLEKGRVLAKIGSQITDVKNQVTALKALNPSRIFLTYGLNDIESGDWNNIQAYTEELGQTVSILKQLCPRATVYVNSILPVQSPAYQESTSYYRLAEYNTAIKAYCKKNSISYIDATAVCEAHTDLFEPDGIHYKETFYPFWANTILSEVYNHEKD